MPTRIPIDRQLKIVILLILRNKVPSAQEYASGYVKGKRNSINLSVKKSKRGSFEVLGGSSSYLIVTSGRLLNS